MASVSALVHKREFDEFPPPVGPKVTVAVYSFPDRTGQKKAVDKFATFSTAVTQGAEAFIIQALRSIGSGTWFTVLERSAIDSLLKERQLIRQGREAYEGSEAKPLRPLLFAGLIIEGGIVGYDSNIGTGGLGARYLGIGPQVEYRTDVVTVALRVLSVATGEILVAISTTKSILSVSVGVNVFKYFDLGTLNLDVNAGVASNEAATYAVRAAIELAVIEAVRQGSKTGLWAIQEVDKGGR